jgi:hypothetical protein
MKIRHLTFDIDWCPDFMILHLLNILKKNSTKAIFFMTHKTQTVEIIRKNGHQIGLHPNIIGCKSTTAAIKKIKKLMKNFPEAKLIKTHGLHMNTYILTEIFKKFKKIKLDMSLLTFKSKIIEKFNYKFCEENIARMNYNWEDSIELHTKNLNWNKINLKSKDIIYNFHPIHIYFNTKNYNHYLKIKKFFHKKIFYKYQYNKKEMDKLINKDLGTRNFLEKIIKKEKFYKIN